MNELYLPIKLLHISTVALSGGIFILRGLLMAANSPLCHQPTLKRFSYLNDSILLGAGLALMLITQQYPGAQTWLSAKLGLLLVYIVLGVFALRKGRTRRQRIGFFIAAVATYLWMLSIARLHSPLGFLAML